MPIAKHKLVFNFTFLLLVSLQHVGCDHDHVCAPSSCGNIANITYPFRLKDDPQHCGKKEFELSCDDNVTVLYLYAGKYHVRGINYENYTVRVVDSGLRPDDCSSLPSHSLSSRNFTSKYPYAPYRYLGRLHKSVRLSESAVFLSCAKQVSSPIYADAGPCLNGTLSVSDTSSYEYVMAGHNKLSEMGDSCRVELVAMTSSFPAGRGGDDEKNVSFGDIHRQLVFGFELSWIFAICNCHPLLDCYFEEDLLPRCDWNIFVGIAGMVPVSLIVWHVARFFLCGVPCFGALLIYKWRRRHLSALDSVEDFLRHHNNFMPIRYAYSDIKTMTQAFKHKLGQGAFGSVYKARLRSGRIVAVKLLTPSTTNGQDFINEVGTIGRIHHVNVVHLIGYCADRSKRALVYEFMPNGSLDKHIFPKRDHVSVSVSMSLSRKQMYDIALGVARGIQYLHRGCDMQILHFDIKPHNILLDHSFTPKVSDFGLAKLYPTGKSVVSLTAARGTMGYMAPELFYNNIGGVSYKADVYSFGMMLMEMVGRRRNLNAFVENASQIYFPSWVYDQLVDKRDIGTILGASEEEVVMTKKMVITGLWCVQTKPEDRPSMDRVVEMLEGDVESLEMPARNPVDDSRLDSLGHVEELEMLLDGSISSTGLRITTS